MFSHTKDWPTSPVRCLAWHPHCNKLAVATRDDTVLVYAGPTSTPVVVRHSSQKNISSLSWRYPFPFPVTETYILYKAQFSDQLFSYQTLMFVSSGCWMRFGRSSLDGRSCFIRHPAFCLMLDPFTPSNFC